MKVEDLLKLIPADTKEQVTQAYRRHNQAIRNAIRYETGLNLSVRAGEGETEGRVKVEVDMVGHPTSIGQKEIPLGKEIAALLSLYQTDLMNLSESGDSIAKLLQNEKIAKIPEVLQMGPAVPRAVNLADFLLKQIQHFDLVQYILEVNEDILGVYKYDPSDRNQPMIFLYWGVIGLVSQALGLNLETLTALVLAHELAHAYTHIGFDIDGQRWTGQAFMKSDHEVNEGLAQYYAARVMLRLRDRFPRGWETYEKLLEKQPPAYHTHKPWLNNYTPEIVRTAFISKRGNIPLKLDPFNEALQDMAPSFNGRWSYPIEGNADVFQPHFSPKPRHRRIPGLPAY